MTEMNRFALAGLAGAAALGLSGAAFAATRTVTINAIDAKGVGAAVGSVTFKDSKQGLLVEPKLTGLPAGPHGFHIHETPNCGPGPGANNQPAAGMAAGGHYDPKGTKMHHGPLATDGHLGDLPVLIVDKDGKADLPVLAPHLKVSNLKGRAVMIHAGGDNYADQPAPLGGGGGRIACGVVK
jgi:Cu-Zn family superoxide dismutase